ncbi:hypothetical protein DYB32_004371 [Aphanomyces invadans]|uniref:Glycosyltransferase 2-like domain-containing protein n=1 Tax=Aphanomyces invadans TaxID=157072 RepID=A0A3R6WMI5_9STRA|nr:hypothetical protein DYB32_004371 [Aphanomyces invadans]
MQICLLLLVPLVALAMGETPTERPYLKFANPNHNETVEHNVYLDPSVQNIPLAFDQADLRPPLPRVPKVFDIFVAISNYRDSVRCGYAVWTAFARADHPEHVFFGIVDQTLPGDSKCLDEYCKLANVTWPNDTCKYSSHIKIDAVNASLSKGPAVARSRQRAMIDDQEFCMSIDAHTQYVYNWDTLIVEDWKLTENEMAVLSNYPLSYAHIGPNFTVPTVPMSRHLCMYGNRPLPNDIPILWPTFITNSERPQMQAFWGGGMSFSKCHAEKRAPIDGHLTWVFMGEEYIRAMQLWTRGYDLYSPSRPRSVLFHNYTDDGAKKSFYENAKDKTKEYHETLLGYNRLRAALKFPFSGEVDFEDMETYYGSPVRTLEMYLNFSKISNTDPKTLDDWPCDQLHWVPYSVPEQIEALLPGWKQYDTSSRAPGRHNSGGSIRGDEDGVVAVNSTAIQLLVDKLNQVLASESMLAQVKKEIHEAQKQMEDATEMSDITLREVVAKLGDVVSRLDALAAQETTNVRDMQPGGVVDTLHSPVPILRPASTDHPWELVLKQQHQAFVGFAVGGALVAVVVLATVWVTRHRANKYTAVETVEDGPSSTWE